MPVEQLVEGVGDHEVGAVLLERLDRPGRALAEALASSFRSLPVRSGFCSLPESANSFSMIFCVSTNQEWSWPVAHDVLERAERVEARGRAARGGACPSASNHSDDGPGRMRMPCFGQTGSQFVMPSM